MQQIIVGPELYPNFISFQFHATHDSNAMEELHLELPHIPRVLGQIYDESFIKFKGDQYEFKKPSKFGKAQYSKECAFELHIIN